MKKESAIKKLTKFVRAGVLGLIATCAAFYAIMYEAIAKRKMSEIQDKEENNANNESDVSESKEVKQAATEALSGNQYEKGAFALNENAQIENPQVNELADNAAQQHVTADDQSAAAATPAEAAMMTAQDLVETAQTSSYSLASGDTSNGIGEGSGQAAGANGASGGGGAPEGQVIEGADKSATIQAEGIAVAETAETPAASPQAPETNNTPPQTTTPTTPETSDTPEVTPTTPTTPETPEGPSTHSIEANPDLMIANHKGFTQKNVLENDVDLYPKRSSFRC